MIYSFHDSARAEYFSAILSYEGARPALGSEFAAEVETAIAAILEAPDRWQKLSKNCRRYKVHRFPYTLIYRVKESSIEILAVSHQHRRPNYWKSRLKK